MIDLRICELCYSLNWNLNTFRYIEIDLLRIIGLLSLLINDELIVLASTKYNLGQISALRVFWEKNSILIMFF